MNAKVDLRKRFFGFKSTHEKRFLSLTGFTLVELLLASGILVAVLATVYASFHTGLFGYRDIEKNIYAYQSARLVLERLDLELRNSFAYSGEDSKFAGENNRLHFLTIVDTYKADEITPEYSFVSYWIQGGTLMRLCRKNKESLNDKSEIQAREMMEGVEAVAFSYGYIPPAGKALLFKEVWDDPGSLPLAVKIRLTLKAVSSESFERTVFLPYGE